MRPFRKLNDRQKHRAFKLLLSPVSAKFILSKMLASRGDRPLQLSFEDQFKALIFYHLQEFSSGRELIQALEQNDFAKECVAPPKGIQKSAFFEAINTRGLDQLVEIFEDLVQQAGSILPAHAAHLGQLVAIDGSLINAVLSMEWADYRNGSKKAKAHFGFDINRGVPRKICLSDGKEGERPFVDQLIDKGETGVMDRGYQSHGHFDQWQDDGKFFVCRIREKTHKTVIKENTVKPDCRRHIILTLKIKMVLYSLSYFTCSRFLATLVSEFFYLRKFLLVTDQYHFQQGLIAPMTRLTVSRS